MLVVVPIAGGFGIAASAADWPLDAVLAGILFELAAGLLVVECSMHDWTRIPFACEHAPDAHTVRSRWLLFVLVLFVFAFVGANVQEAALGSARGRIVYVAFVSAFAATLYALHSRRARRLTVEFDEAPHDALNTLNLSEALR